MDEKSFTTKDAKDENDVINFYDQYASSWDQRFGQSISTGHFLQRRWSSFESIIEDFNDRNAAVELGIGTGVYIQKTSSVFRNIIAVDGSALMLDELQKKLRAYNISNVRIIQSNALSIPDITSGSIDCVFFFGLIEHIQNIELFVNEIRRMLRNEGIVVGIAPNGQSPWYWFRRYVRLTGKHCSSDKYYSKKELIAIF
jgi:ubiquinone/menaquinone biosynthesis C-methylase UbiE